MFTVFIIRSNFRW